MADRDIRAQLRDTIHHLEHVLPGQAPIRDFVHHNTLHGFQHLPFAEALEAARQLTGAEGYLPEARFRDFYRQGRIERTDLEAVLDEHAELAAAREAAPGLKRKDIYLAALLYPLKAVSPSQLNWQLDEQQALRRLQADVTADARHRLLAEGRDEAATVQSLWDSCLDLLELEHDPLHPEEMLELSPEQAEAMLSELGPEGGGETGQAMLERLVRKQSEHELKHLLERVGDDLSLRGLLLALSGHDLLDELRPLLIRHLASHLDQGMAAWHNTAREQGFYRAWRDSALCDPAWMLDDLPDWSDHIGSLPEDPFEVVLQTLRRLGLDEERWAGYLQQLALELPGWSGMFLWRHLHPDYQGLGRIPVDMIDYLAVRLTLEQLHARRLCARLWQVEPTLDMLRWYFRQQPGELLVRLALFRDELPEFLTHQAQRLTTQEGTAGTEAWMPLAQRIRAWRHSPAARTGGRSVYDQGWRLFRLCQLLGLDAQQLAGWEGEQVDAIFACLDTLTPAVRGQLWLEAYEGHYREQLYSVLANNRGRGPWKQRAQRPDAQVIFCMDDREEGIRRHLEELNPAIETLGAAGFFGVAINWRGLDDEQVTALCPVVVTPAHEVREQPRPGEEAQQRQHSQRRGLRLMLQNALHQETRRGLATGALAAVLAAPLALLGLAGKLLAPRAIGYINAGLRHRCDLQVATELAITNPHHDHVASPEAPNRGFTDQEQADRVQGFLRTVGLLTGQAPLVVLMGHGSSSQNNPHLAAYDCGACSGRHGGPNARAFASMGNRPEVRALLAERGTPIPDDCWFLGAEHDTCDDGISWYDSDKLPTDLVPAFEKLRGELEVASTRSAHERCRRFASAPDAPSPEQALKHVIARSLDISQARPELGHATNAAALIGRRSVTRGAFFDRRLFLISYDPSTDPDGSIVEAILLAVGPVGAGINLEYYFSTVNNEQYGCGTKVVHNLAGLLGVMEGTSSDLRTGLPLQMIEIHEAMRLQVVVEAKTEILTAIYQRQPPLQELVGKGWLLLSAIDPDDGAIHRFDPARGWLTWDVPAQALPEVELSTDWYTGHREPLTPALIRRATACKQEPGHA